MFHMKNDIDALEKVNMSDEQIKKLVDRDYRERNGFNLWTDIKTYFYLILHPRKAIDLKYDDDLRTQANLREIKERIETGMTRKEYWAKVLGHD